MSDPSEKIDASDAILDGAADVAEGVVQIARGFSGLALSGAFVVGAGVGGAIGFFVSKRMMETKYSQFAAEEIAAMREHYADKIVALEASATKPGLEALVRNQGYSTEEPKSAQPPMAVTPPAAVVEAAEEAKEDQSMPAKARVEFEGLPVEEPEVRNIFRDNEPPEDVWDYAHERARRSPLRPYVIHKDEREEHNAYDSVTFTYYEEDDVLANERDEPLSQEERERIIGEAHLSQFGHGSDDSDIVYIRNDQLSMDIEVVRSPNSFAEEVHGIEPEIRHSDRRRERVRFDDE